MVYSDPDAEEKETELKASAMIEALTNKPRPNAISSASVSVGSDSKLESEVQARVLLVDHEDSFVHTLADYLRQTGAEVATCRCGESLHDFFKYKVDTGIFKPTLVVLSPGPGNPSDFKLSDTISFMINKKIPMFGVCLGLQGLVEYFGGKLSILSTPMHGKSSVIRRVGNMKNKHDVLSGLPQEFQVGRYHSLHGESSSIRDLVVTAQSSDGVIMALCHEKLPIAAVQFHPESILTLPKTGLKILRNAIDILKSDAYD